MFTCYYVILGLQFRKSFNDSSFINFMLILIYFILILFLLTPYWFILTSAPRAELSDNYHMCICEFLQPVICMIWFCPNFDCISCFLLLLTILYINTLSTVFFERVNAFLSEVTVNSQELAHLTTNTWNFVLFTISLTLCILDALYFIFIDFEWICKINKAFASCGILFALNINLCKFMVFVNCI